MTRTSTFRRALLAGLAALCTTVAQAPSFAGHPIRILAGDAPGGVDVLAKLSAMPDVGKNLKLD